MQSSAYLSFKFGYLGLELLNLLSSSLVSLLTRLNDRLGLGTVGDCLFVVYGELARH